MKIASFPPNIPRPSIHDAARHINEEARLVLASLRGGPPYIARGELALGLRELRALVRGRFLDANVGGGGVENPGGESCSTSNFDLGVISPTHAIFDSAEVHNDGNKTVTADEAAQDEPAPQEQRHQAMPPASPPTPHSVPPSSPSYDPTRPPGSLSVPALSLPFLPPHKHHNQPPRPLQEKQQLTLDPGPHAAPFLAVIVDPRAAGPHTLVALRALHRLLERGSIVQLTRCTNHNRGNNVSGNGDNHRNVERANEGQVDSQQQMDALAHIVHETSLEPIARGVLACRFEQTDAGADEAVEMAIADLLKLLVELDAAGARAAEAALLRQVFLTVRERQTQQLQLDDGTSKLSFEAPEKVANDQDVPQRSSARSMISVQRLPSSVVMEAFQVVFVTRLTFVRDGGGHHSPALSFHFEQVLMRIVHVVFGVEDAQSTLKSSVSNSLSSRISSRHLTGGRKILQFLIDSLSLRNTDGGDKWNDNMVGYESMGDDTRMLCLRLIQCCLSTGWGSNAAVSTEVKYPSSLSVQQSSVTAVEEDVLRLIGDDLCLALLRAGQAPLEHDLIPSSNATSSSSSGADVLGDGRSTISLELLSQICATFSLMWSLPKLRPYLTLQFESVFSGFYQRALSLLRRRPLPADGIEYQANMIFDMEVEVILESLVDILCLSSGHAGGKAGKPMSTIDELFWTYDCSMTQSDVASGLLAELCRCCGGLVDEEGEPYLPSTPSRSGTTSASTPRSNDPEYKISPMLIARYRSVPDHLKELCFEALIGSIRCFFNSVESTLGETFKATSSLRKTKNKKRILHHAARLFNEKPKMGLKYLVENGMLPIPPNPQSVADFLRNGLVVGLNKSAVGQYLGEVGKSAKDTDESTPVWEQDWFHKELLTAFCSSFSFEHQTVLDGLRMFLSTFRLPGEAQMIDRVLQAFAESIACQCEESIRGSLKLFSADEKRASDTAYLLSFSIIILNTDLHNENIKANRRMKLADFIRNNKNYGKDISDGDLPDEYLEGIYQNIKEFQIRTLGEGADGSMTIERWKDVMRSAAPFQSHAETIQAGSDAKDQKELLLECVWLPILSAVSGLWGIVPMGAYHADMSTVPDRKGIVSATRLGIDLAYEMFSGASKLRRPDIFQEMFTNICYMTGLLGEYDRAWEERAYDFIKTIERQSAFTVAFNITEEYGDLIGLDGWKCVWSMLFELRDLKLLSGRGHRSILKESDPDMLSPKARLDFNKRMVSFSFNEVEEPVEGPTRKMSLMNFVFGSTSSLDGGKNALAQGRSTRSTHGKEDDLIWDDLASSNEENERSPEDLSFPSESQRRISSIGASFERQLMYEDTLDNEIVGVTGLERIDVSHTNPNSTRARVRQRLSQLVDFDGLIGESRYLSEEGLSDELNSLVEIICDSSKMTSSSAHGTDNNGALLGLPLSPASEAFAEILLCEIALRNRDRFALIWDTILRAHYNSRLTYRHSRERERGDEDHQPETIKLTSGIEKCVTGILRLCVRTSNRNVISNEVLSMLNILHPPLGLLLSPLELNLDKHLAEGLWRVVQNVDGLTQINDEGWSGILGLAEWCATRGGLRSSDLNQNAGSLAEDDPSLQTFKSLHLILHAAELKNALRIERWPQIVRSVRCLVEAGERGQCPKLSIAGLDLLQVLHTRMDSIAAKDGEPQHLLNVWLPILEAISEPAEKSRNGSVRQQAISLLTDTLLDKNSSSIPVEGGLCDILNNICLPLAGKRITDLLRIPREVESDLGETLIEVELCIALLFKPFLHHLKTLVYVKQEFFGIWISVLGIMKQLLGDEIQNKSDSKVARGDVVSRAKLFSTTKELASEHLRNAVMVLAAMGVLVADGDSKSDTQEISSVTWAAIGSIGYCKPVLDEWKRSACQ